MNPDEDLQNENEATNPEKSHITPERWEERFTTHEGEMIFFDPTHLTPKEAAGEAENPEDEKWLED